MDAVRAEIGRMERGDILILVPITGDELNDAGGRILRLQAPTTRESYDADLRRFRKDAVTQFAAWSATLGAERNRTDILGSLDLARQEMESLPRTSHRRLVIVSDFIEDDGALRFTSDLSLANATRANALAARLRAGHRFSLQGVSICLGRLESVDFASLPPTRQAAIDAFWETYLADDGRTPEIEIDGLGMLGAADRCLTEPSGSSRSRKGTR
jgi:hypothetical protein